MMTEIRWSENVDSGGGTMLVTVQMMLIRPNNDKHGFAVSHLKSVINLAITSPALLWRLIMQTNCVKWLRLLQTHKIIQQNTRMDDKTT